MINSISDAITHGLIEVGKHEKIKDHKTIFGEKGVTGALIITENNVYSLHFRKNLYRSFSYEQGGVRVNGLGVAKDKEHLYNCIEEDYIQMIVLEDGKIYVYKTSDWIDWCEVRLHDSNVIKTIDDREVKVDKWTYYNIPLSIMVNYNKWVANDFEY